MSMKLGNSNLCPNGCGDYIASVIGNWLKWICPRCMGTLYTGLDGKEPDDVAAMMRDIETWKERV